MFKVKCGPLRCEVARGEDIEAGGWRLTPIAGLLALTYRRATVGEGATTLGGAQFACVRPLAVEIVGNGERRLVLLPDVTRLLVGVLCLGALASWLAALNALGRACKK